METTDLITPEGKVAEGFVDENIELEKENIKTSDNNNTLLDANSNKNKEGLDSGDCRTETGKDRNALFELGLKEEKKGNYGAAIDYYLDSLKGLQTKAQFSHLPQCLHNIAVIYRDQGKYEQAVQFAQAEKFFYESSLTNSEEIQKKLDEVAGEKVGDPKDLNELNIETLKADEYEHMAKLCMEKNQKDLALKYCGKSTKIRQQVYGNNHEKTKASLKFFTAIYTEIEKIPNSVRLLNNNPDSVDVIAKTPDMILSAQAGGEPVSILRQRSEDGFKDGAREKKQVHFHESVDESIRNREKEKLASSIIKQFRIAVCIVLLATLGMWLYCLVSKSQSCQRPMAQLYQWIQTLQHYCHLLTTAPPAPL